MYFPLIVLALPHLKKSKNITEPAVKSTGYESPIPKQSADFPGAFLKIPPSVSKQPKFVSAARLTKGTHTYPLKQEIKNTKEIRVLCMMTYSSGLEGESAGHSLI